ncbi:MAG: site-2 protease family protein [Candidatus Harrisonbacteria bacterium]|nr:site-2 protease family protein [Candidatus Harrisonbacteria bacterium]
MSADPLRGPKWILRIFLVLAVLEACFALHEFGHFRECQKRNIPVEEFSLGLGPILYSHDMGGWNLNVRLIPIMAYVRPTKAGNLKEKAMPVLDRCMISLAGVRNNALGVIFTVLLLQLLAVWNGKLSWKDFSCNAAELPLQLLLSAALFFTHFFTFSSHVKLPLRVGPVAVNDAVKYFLHFNLMLFVLNLMPAGFLDGGRIFFDVGAYFINDTVLSVFWIYSMFTLFSAVFRCSIDIKIVQE